MSDVPVLQLVNQLAIGGAEGQFVARLRWHPKGFRPLVGCLKKEGPHLKEIEELGIPLEQFGLKGGLGQLNTGREILRLAALIEREGVKLVHANDFYANVLAVPAARLAGVKVIVSRFDLGHWYSRAHHVLEAIASRAADAIYTNARAVRDMCVDEEGAAPERVVVVHNGLDVRAFDAAMKLEPSPAIPQLELGDDGRARRKTIAILANLYPVKGHLDLIEAVEKVRRNVPDVLVLCAGEGEMRAALEQQISSRGLRDHVLLLGHRLDAGALLARAHVACSASHAEGLSNAVIEAMAASLPVVATSVGGNVELVCEGPGPCATGHLVPPHAPEVLAERLEVLLLDSARAHAYGAAARLRVETELTMEAFSRSTGELYQRVISGGRAEVPRAA